MTNTRFAEVSAALTHASHLPLNLNSPYLIKNWIAPGTLAVLYGPPNVGKSFLALNLAHAIATGLPWAGERTTKSICIYAALEGAQSFARRIHAIGDGSIWVISLPMTFASRNSIDTMALIHAVGTLQPRHGPPGLIVIDTLARAMVGADENSGLDMGILIHQMDQIRKVTGAAVLLVHHSGKNRELGARGHSSLKAAVDTEMELARDEESGIITATATKQRDFQAGAQFHFRLKQVELGRDQDGDPVTTCIVEPAEPPAPSSEPTPRPRLTGKERIALEALGTALRDHGKTMRGADWPNVPTVTADEWREACFLHGLFEDPTSSAARMVIRRTRDGLHEKGVVRSFGDRWWLASSEE